MKLDGVSTVALLFLFSFAIERTVSGLVFICNRAGWLDPERAPNPTARVDVERNVKLFSFVVGAIMSGIILKLFDLHGILAILGSKQDPQLLDTALTILVMVAGADRLGDISKSYGPMRSEPKAEPPLIVTGTLKLDEASAAKLAAQAGYRG